MSSGTRAMEDDMELHDSSPYLNQDAASAFLGLSARTLERFRVDGRGPQYLKLGRRVAYTRADLIAWAESQRRSSTSECAPDSSGMTRTRRARGAA